jgi:hypothetical protein
MNIKELEASDFPGIDATKFDEWKALRIKTNRELNLAWCLMLTFLIVSRFIHLSESLFSTLIKIAWLAFLPIAVVILVSYLMKSKRMNQLDKEIKINARLKARKKGVAFTE